MVLALAPIFSAIFILQNDLKTQEIITRYGSLFSEFKNNRGILSSMFYPIYYLRRIVFALSQVMLNNYPIIQVSMNLGFNFLQFSHLIYYRPFKDIDVLISEFVGESCTLFVSGVICFLLKKNSNEELKLIEDLIIYSILSCGIIQYLVCLRSLLASISKLIKKSLKSRAKEFIKNEKIIISNNKIDP